MSSTEIIGWIMCIRIYPSMLRNTTYEEAVNHGVAFDNIDIDKMYVMATGMYEPSKLKLLRWPGKTNKFMPSSIYKHGVLFLEYATSQIQIYIHSVATCRDSKCDEIK